MNSFFRFLPTQHIECSKRKWTCSFIPFIVVAFCEFKRLCTKGISNLNCANQTKVHLLCIFKFDIIQGKSMFLDVTKITYCKLMFCIFCQISKFFFKWPGLLWFFNFSCNLQNWCKNGFPNNFFLWKRNSFFYLFSKRFSLRLFYIVAV